jgi:FlaA1/EpsC-like NDP-sugar epimerase
VLGTSEQLRELIIEHAASDVVVCAQSISRPSLERVMEQCQQLGVKAHVIPTIAQILEPTTAQV